MTGLRYLHVLWRRSFEKKGPQRKRYLRVTPEVRLGNRWLQEALAITQDGGRLYVAISNPEPGTLIVTKATPPASWLRAQERRQRKRRRPRTPPTAEQSA